MKTILSRLALPLSIFVLVMPLRTTAATTPGNVFAFGNNNLGALGMNSTDQYPTLVAAPIITANLGSRQVTQVSAGWAYSLILADDGSVFSFGSNLYGQTGLGTTSGGTLLATPIDTTNLGSRKITQVSAGGFGSLILADDGSVF